MSMKHLDQYVAFDIEFNTVNNVSHIIQLSAVKFHKHHEIDHFDTYVYSDIPLQSFINGLTGITADKINHAPKLDTVLNDFNQFINHSPLIGYNAYKSDLPLLAQNGLSLDDLYAVDVYEQAQERRSNDLNGIVNLKLQTVAQFLGIRGKGHNSLDDARMTALVYETFMELDQNKTYLQNQAKDQADNPFASLNGLF